MSQPPLRARFFLLATLLLLFAFSCTLLLLPPTSHAATTPIKVLFDDAHAETAGNADWIISTSMPDPLAQNPNPQVETSWTGGISAWGVALQKTGRYSLKTNTGALTYGNASNALDLSNFNVLVLPEPNTLFTSSEKTAILTFVHNGGGLFMIADHNGSDRNNDGADSLHIFNDLMNNNGVASDPFGIQFDVLDISNENPGNDTPNGDPVLNGPFGQAQSSIIRDGTTETLHPADNSSVHGIIYRSSSSNTGTTGVFLSGSSYGSGRVLAIGDTPITNCLQGSQDCPTAVEDPYVHKIIAMRGFRGSHKPESGQRRGTTRRWNGYRLSDAIRTVIVAAQMRLARAGVRIRRIDELKSTTGTLFPGCTSLLKAPILDQITCGVWSWGWSWRSWSWTWSWRGWSWTWRSWRWRWRWRNCATCKPLGSIREED
ncbi:MAG TPA: hypothetical protein VH593_22485, partial [Ktedonobacteraceae bacterium]